VKKRIAVCLTACILGGVVPWLVARQRQRAIAKTDAEQAVIQLAQDRILEMLSCPATARWGECSVRMVKCHRVVLGAVDSENRIGAVIHGHYAAIVEGQEVVAWELFDSDDDPLLAAIREGRALPRPKEAFTFVGARGK
jgi:hypothetical protein